MEISLESSLFPPLTPSPYGVFSDNAFTDWKKYINLCLPLDSHWSEMINNGRRDWSGYRPHYCISFRGHWWEVHLPTSLLVHPTLPRTQRSFVPGYPLLFHPFISSNYHSFLSRALILSCSKHQGQVWGLSVDSVSSSSMFFKKEEFCELWIPEKGSCVLKMPRGQWTDESTESWNVTDPQANYPRLPLGPLRNLRR